MKFDGDAIMNLLATWRRMGRKTTFNANEHGAYVFDRKTGETLQFVTPEGMRN
jgi:hypothetical protein